MNFKSIPFSKISSLFSSKTFSLCYILSCLMCFKRNVGTKPNVDVGKIKQAFFKKKII